MSRGARRLATSRATPSCQFGPATKNIDAAPAAPAQANPASMCRLRDVRSAIAPTIGRNSADSEGREGDGVGRQRTGGHRDPEHVDGSGARVFRGSGPSAGRGLGDGGQVRAEQHSAGRGDERRVRPVVEVPCPLLCRPLAGIGERPGRYQRPGHGAPSVRRIGGLAGPYPYTRRPGKLLGAGR